MPIPAAPAPNIRCLQSKFMRATCFPDLDPLLVPVPYTLLADGLGDTLVGETLGLGVFLRGGGAA